MRQTIFMHSWHRPVRDNMRGCLSETQSLPRLSQKSWEQRLNWDEAGELPQCTQKYVLTNSVSWRQHLNLTFCNRVLVHINIYIYPNTLNLMLTTVIFHYTYFHLVRISLELPIKFFRCSSSIDRSHEPNLHLAAPDPRSLILELRLPWHLRKWSDWTASPKVCQFGSLPSAHFSLKLSLPSAPQLPERLHLLDPWRSAPNDRPGKTLANSNRKSSASGQWVNFSPRKKRKTHRNQLENPRRWPAINHRSRLSSESNLWPASETLQMGYSWDYRKAHQVVSPPWTLSHVAEFAEMERKVARGLRREQKKFDFPESRTCKCLINQLLRPSPEIGDGLLTQNPATVLPLAHGNQRVKRPGNGPRFQWRPQLQ